MSMQPLFYKNIVPLNKERHKDMYIEASESFAFAGESNSLYIAAVEFPRAAAEYPIVFGSDGEGNVFPVVLLGLKNNQNLFVDKKGKWNADYIPAYTRRYPFILAASGGEGEEQFTVCIDEGYPGFNTAKKGQPLFDDKGEQSTVLKQAVDFLKDYQNHIRLTSEFCRNLASLEILEPMQANIEMKAGDKFAIGGFQCVSRDKLKALAPEKLRALVQSGQMELIYAHLLSLNNINALMNKLSRTGKK
jgi:hypothetical protein